MRKLFPVGRTKLRYSRAKLAGLPEEVLQRAKEILWELEKPVLPRITINQRKEKPMQISFFVLIRPKTLLLLN